MSEVLSGPETLLPEPGPLKPGSVGDAESQRIGLIEDPSIYLYDAAQGPVGQVGQFRRDQDQVRGRVEFTEVVGRIVRRVVQSPRVEKSHERGGVDHAFTPTTQ